MPIGGEIVLTQKAEGGSIAADLAVIQGTAADQVKLPAATGDRAKGITALAADAAGKAIPIIIRGPAVGTAAAATTAGSFVKVAAAPPPQHLPHHLHRHRHRHRQRCRHLLRRT